MSIIYEALKKTQEQRKVASEVTMIKRPKAKRKSFTFSFKNYKIIALAFALISMIALVAFYSIYLFQPKAKPPIAKPTMTKLTLNGIFSSDDEKIAMINNNIMHVGDRVAGMQITKIDYPTVTLSNGKQAVTLHF